MATLTPNHGLPGQILQITVQGFRTDLGPSPEITFIPVPHIQQVKVIPGTIHQIQPGHYEFDITISTKANMRQYSLLIRRDNSPLSEAEYRAHFAGTFRVGSITTPSPVFPVSNKAGMTSRIPTSTSATNTVISSTTSKQSPIIDIEARILEAEVKILEELAKVAPEKICDSEWLKAAAEKECCAAKLIDALSEKSKTCTKPLQDNAPSDPANGGGTPIPFIPGIHVRDGEEEQQFPSTRTRTKPEFYTIQENSKDDCDGDGVCKHGCSVLLHNGEERFDRIDLTIPGRGDLNFVMKRRYRSHLNYNGPLGFGWDFDYNDSLFPQVNGDVIRSNGRSHLDRWILNTDGSFSAPKGHFRTLIQEPGGGRYILRSADGFKRFYLPDGKLEKYQDRFGNMMLFEYDPRGNLHLLIDPYGRGIEFDFRTIPDQHGNLIDRLSYIRDFSGREVQYMYDDRGDLIAVRSPIVTNTSTNNDFPEGRTEHYSYSFGYTEQVLNHNILSATSAEEVAVGGPPTITWTYGTDPNDPATFAKVLSETVGGINASGITAGGTTTYEYEALNENIPLGNPDIQRGKVTITDPVGNQQIFFGNENRDHILTLQMTRGIRSEEPPFYATRTYFNNESLKTRRIFPNGNEQHWTYDNSPTRSRQRNIVETRKIADMVRGGGEDIVTTMTYEPLFNQIASITEPRGNASGFAPPIGTASSDRYTTRYFYDYQEGSDPIADAINFGLDISGVSRGLGDLNNDNRTDQTSGNLIMIKMPSVQLLSDSNEAIRLGNTTQEHIIQNQWNDRGQITNIIDQEGNITEYDYYPENNPSGDGNITSTGFLPLTDQASGYLRSVNIDSKTSPRRTSSSSPTALKTTYHYNSVGNVVAILNPRGILTNIEVNQLNEPIAITRGFKVDDAISSGQLITGEAPLAYQTRLFYDHNGRVIKTQTENRDLRTEGIGDFVEHKSNYDILGNTLETILEVDVNKSVHSHYRYNENSLLVSSIQPEGNEIQFTYDDRNLLFNITRGYGTAEESIRQTSYDPNGNIIKEIDGEDKNSDSEREGTQFIYDGFDRLTEVIDALGNKAISHYDIASDVVRFEGYGHPAGNPAGPLTLLADMAYSYDEQNRVYQIDRSLFLSDGFTPQRPVDLKDHNSDGVVTTKIEYDALSQITYKIQDDGEISQTIYDSARRQLETIDASGNKIISEYDQNSNPIRATSIEVSPDGLVLDESYTTVYVYDQLDRLVRITDNAGQTSRFIYDSHDNLIFQSDPEGAPIPDPLNLFPQTGQSGHINEIGNTKHFYYDGLNRLLKEVCDLLQNGVGGNPLDLSNIYNPSGQVSLSYDYDDNSRLTGIADNNGNRTVFDYDPLDRKTSHTYADGKAYSYQYDRDDNLRKIVDPNGSIVTRSYDPLSRLIRCTISRSANVNGTIQESYEYDGLSRLTKSTDDNGDPTRMQSCEFIYDSLSRVLEEQQNGKAISNVFNGDDTRFSCTYPGDRKIINKHDVINRIKSIHDGDGLISEAFYMGPEMRELKRTNKNGTTLSFLNDAGDQTSGYDTVKRIVHLRAFLPDGVTAFLDREYGYNRANQRTFEKRNDDSGLTDKYTYDSIYRISSTQLDQDGLPNSTPRDLRQLNYQLDGVGNRRQVSQTMTTSKTNIEYAVNQLNEYPEISGVILEYDNNGNLTSDSKRRFIYDYKNRLTSVYDKNKLIVSYFYDVMNRRRKKIVYDRSHPGQIKKETEFYYDDWQVCEEQNNSNKTEITYAYSPVYIDEPVQFIRTEHHSLGKGEFYTHQDARANIIAITDSNAEVIEKRYYDEFGLSYDENKQLLPGSQVGNPYGFQGRRLDPETGLYYFRNRYFSPVLGRFLQRDPVWDDDNIGNQYTFAGNSAISRLDPYGLWSPKVHDVLFEDLAKEFDEISDWDRRLMAFASKKLDKETAADYNSAHKHHQRKGDEPVGKTMKKIDKWINDRLNAAAQAEFDAGKDKLEGKSIEAKGKHMKAMKELGKAFHTIQDKWSPAHRDEKNKRPSSWWGFDNEIFIWRTLSSLIHSPCECWGIENLDNLKAFHRAQIREESKKYFNIYLEKLKELKKQDNKKNTGVWQTPKKSDARKKSNYWKKVLDR